MVELPLFLFNVRNMEKNSTDTEMINLVLVDDSLVFRKIFREMVADSEDIKIVGEAGNGIDALALILKLNPTVIIMDLEMPLMDGMIALQHLMIHIPTPTIMISDLTHEGTARAFDSLKNGAVDFVHKGLFLKEASIITTKELMIAKIKSAHRIMVEAIEPLYPADLTLYKSLPYKNNVGFCEECGARIMIDQHHVSQSQQVICGKCGERMDLNLIKKHLRVNSLIVLGAGEGTYSNLLKIIPQINSGINGSIIVIMYGKTAHIDSFVKYLDSVSVINVSRCKDGMTLTGGTCYIGSSDDKIVMSSHKTDYTLKSSIEEGSEDQFPLDMFMKSVSLIFKNRLLGVILSGSQLDGGQGLNAIQENGGSCYMFNPDKCLHKQMARNIASQYNIETIADEKTVLEKIQKFFDNFKKSIITA